MGANDTSFQCDGSNSTFRVMFKEPVEILPNTSYTACSTLKVPYFFGYKTEFFSFQNNPKDLDPSSKMDLDLLDCLGRVKLVL